MFADTKIHIRTAIITDKHPLTVILLKNMFRSVCCIIFTFLLDVVKLMVFKKKIHWLRLFKAALLLEFTSMMKGAA